MTAREPGGRSRRSPNVVTGCDGWQASVKPWLIASADRSPSCCSMRAHAVTTNGLPKSEGRSREKSGDHSHDNFVHYSVSLFWRSTNLSCVWVFLNGCPRKNGSGRRRPEPSSFPLRSVLYKYFQAWSHPIRLNEGCSMSKKAWPFRPSHVRRGIRAVESAGKTASSVKIGNGWFEVLIGGHEEL